jgi:hypothetical protein
MTEQFLCKQRWWLFLSDTDDCVSPRGLDSMADTRLSSVGLPTTPAMSAGASDCRRTGRTILHRWKLILKCKIHLVYVVTLNTEGLLFRCIV